MRGKLVALQASLRFRGISSPSIFEDFGRLQFDIAQDAVNKILMSLIPY
jgi:hypothetical protein